MKISELRDKLLEAYRVENLNRISLTLINLYKNKQFKTLDRIAESISDCVSIKIDENGKGFSKLMMLYHPDKAKFHISEIHKYAGLGMVDKLRSYSHILKLEGIEEMGTLQHTSEDIDFSPVYEWEPDIDGFSVIDGNQKRSKVKKKDIFYSFYDAIKMRQYGNTKTDFPSYYLEDFEEYELSSASIDDLDGIQFCIHAKIIDLSENSVTDLSPLEGLDQLEEINLSGNKISDIDPLKCLSLLKCVDLSDNQINDISPLLYLDSLEYVNLTGNPVDMIQIIGLRESGVVVDS